MSVTTAINLALVLMCLLVMIQAMRMDRRIRALRDGQLERAVEALDNSTQQARLVLAELKRVLSTDAVAYGEIIEISRELRDELSLMIGVGNSVADRILDASDKARDPDPARGRPASRPAASWVDEMEAEPAQDPAPVIASEAAAAAEEGRDLRSIVFSLSSRRGNRVA
ncbi:DUF6468 domain-containing protein [Novosphingobium colocasiae]|uniref:DUF6468 domain-containing protein n=1 Tax=Novosphingobium colocasiae TaxID=1256513 RepID=UPI0035AE5188